jgi:hypothetical protein
MNELPRKDADLLAGLARRDPARGYPVQPADDPAARDLVAGIMATPVEDAPRAAPARRRPALAVAAAVLVVGAAVGVGIGATGGSRPGTGGRTLAILAPVPDIASSCAVPDAASLAARGPIAFEGTATTVTPDRVTLEVRRWFTDRPDGVTRVELATPDPGTALAVDGVTFTAGRSYLVSAADGAVLGCGFTGEAGPELLALFTEAFRLDR